MKNNLRISFKSCWHPFTTTYEVVSRWLPRNAHRRNCDSSFCSAGIFTLAKLPCGICATIKTLNLANDEAEKLRRVGIREGGRISLISRNDPMLVLVENARIALSHRLAPQVQVQSIPTEDPAK